jgi:hypothetical protein
MKRLFFLLLFSISAVFTFSQELQFSSGREKHNGKPPLFQNVSQKSTVKADFAEEIMSYQLNQPVVVEIVNGFVFKGTVTAVTSDAPGLTTVIIRSAEVNGLQFSLSRVVFSDQSVHYKGLLFSNAHSDLLMMEKDPVTGNYNWNKKMLSAVLTD